MRINWKTGLTAAVAAVIVGTSASSADAAAITCMPIDDRVATLDSAVSCSTADSTNINSSSVLNSVLGTSYSWVKEGEVALPDGSVGATNDLLTISLTSGVWGGNDVAGTWAINPSFWLDYTIASITMHVGQGNGNPDAFAWIITPGATSGTFTYEDLDGRGGGLSNFFLFGTEPPTTPPVPEPGTALLAALGLVSVVGVRAVNRKK